MLKFLVDESSGLSIFIFLKNEGFGVQFVSYLMPGAEDLDVLKLAEKEKRILITNDKDFGELIFKFNFASFGIIFLRLRRDSSLKRVAQIGYLIKNYSDRLENHFITISESKIRFRSLK